MPKSDPVLERMVEAFNHTSNDTLSDGLFDEKIVIHFFISGRSGEMRVMQGLDETMAWMHRAPEGKFTISLVESAPCDPHPELPTGERAVWARYLVSLTEDEFENEGEWTLHIADDRIVGLRVEPNDLE